jgi:hypothetical protein
MSNRKSLARLTHMCAESAQAFLDLPFIIWSAYFGTPTYANRKIATLNLEVLCEKTIAN